MNAMNSSSGSPSLLLVSLGPDPRRTATLDSLCAFLESSRRFAPPRPRSALRSWGIDAEAFRPAAVWGALCAGETVALAFEGDVPRGLLLRCARARMPYRVLPCLGAADLALVRRGLVLGHDARGLRVREDGGVRFVRGPVVS